jgi:nitrite reductase/ring-hydroxylating ferredoxin subunit
MSDPASWIGRDLPPIWRNGESYFLLGHAGSIYLMRNHCPHRGGPLKFGHVTHDAQIVCPMHNNSFPIAALIAQPSTVILMEGGQ